MLFVIPTTKSKDDELRMIAEELARIGARITDLTARLRDLA